MTQWVENTTLSLLCCVFIPWPGNFCMLWMWHLTNKQTNLKKLMEARQWNDVLKVQRGIPVVAQWVKNPTAAAQVAADTV